jgi:fibro-slime domain-containing protein
MSDWKRWVLSGALVSSIACSDSDGTSNPDGGRPGNGNLDGSSGSGGEGGSSGRGDGATNGGGGDGGMGGGTGDGGACGAILKARVRDFQDTHPDFEKFNGSGATKGLVQTMLGSDFKPVHAAAGPTAQTTGPANFAQWYNDVSGVNLPIDISIPLTRGSAGYVFDSTAFFPVDDKVGPPLVKQGFGNTAGRMHNYHFTTEIHTEFTYSGGERFTFRGDDDLWIFVNGRLALDIGGLHTAVQDEINFDNQANALGIEKGKTYRMDIFHAERHTVDSNFRISTNIACFTDVPVLF